MDFAIFIEIKDRRVAALSLTMGEDEYELVVEIFNKFVTESRARGFGGNVLLVKLAPNSLEEVDDECVSTYEHNPWVVGVIEAVFSDEDDENDWFYPMPTDFSPEMN